MAGPSLHLALLGLGEAASAFASGWDRRSLSAISAFDVKSLTDEGRALIDDRGRKLLVLTAAEPEAALKPADVVISLVTADRAFEAASDAAPHVQEGRLFLDGNSCAPGTKVRSAAAIEASGASFVDMAIMAPVHPRREKTPVLLSGPQAELAGAFLSALGMNVRTVGDRVGQASAIKLTRSVMIKGLEALFAECFLAARLGGVEEEVLASLEASDPDIAWRSRLAYILQRMTEHGLRRSAEMAEAATMVGELGLPSGMSRGSTEWQALLGELPLVADDMTPILDALGLTGSRPRDG